ncbi:MAG: choice-of-anchor Q domain-containing protein [Myxococcota bacterium]
MMNHRRLCFSVFTCLLTVAAVSAAPSKAWALNVGINGGPCTFFSIDDALAASSPGDVLYARPGVYIEPVLVVRDDVTVASSNGSCDVVTSRQVTILSQLGVRIFDVAFAGLTTKGLILTSVSNVEAMVVGSNGATIILEDTRVENGTSIADGGCVDIQDTDFAMRDSEMEDCIAQGSGGGVYCEDNCKIWLYDTRFLRNEAQAGGLGGAIFHNGGSFFYNSGVWIASNSAERDGGGVYMRNATGSIRGQISSNEAGENGGGIYVVGSPGNTLVSELTLSSGSRVEHNVAAFNGGGVRSLDATLNAFGEVEIGNNAAGGFGGGVAAFDTDFFFDATPLDGIAFRNNRATFGAGLSASFSRGTLEGTLFVDNQEADRGGGLFVNTESEIYFLNARFVRNSADEGGGAFLEDAFVGFAADFEQCGPAVLGKDDYCSEFVINDSTREGGGAYVGVLANVEFLHTGFKGNFSGATGGAVYLSDDSSSVRMWNDVVFNDETQTGAAVVAAAGELDLRSSTLADNPAPAVYGPAATGSFNGNVVWDNAVDVVAGTVPGDCNITQTAAGAPTGVLNVQVDPTFDAGHPRARYRLQAGSPAIDACAAGPLEDVDGTPRPQGPRFDRGAFEEP